MRGPGRTLKTWAAYLGMAMLIVGTALALDNPRAMSAVWYGPYLSAAENASWGGQFLVNLEEVKAFREMTEKQRLQYRFHRTDALRPYIANPLGFAYVITAAKTAFPWLPDVRALEAFQVLIHALLSVLIISLLSGPRMKVLFLVLYALNPLVIYFVTFPYYYFYQAIPSFALLFLFLGRRQWSTSATRLQSVTLLLLSVALAFVVLMRSTTVAAVAAFFVLAFMWFPSRKLVIASAAVFLAIVLTGHSPTQKNFWHTAYVGIGAYPNEHVRGLSDDNGYSLFEQKTGLPLDASLGGNYYEPDVMSKYRDISRQEFQNIAREDPLMLGRNATLNTLQGFTIGYLANQPYPIHLLMAALGFAFLGAMIWAGQWLLASLIILTLATFVPYYPPIPAYMYGAYPLLVMAAIQILQQILQRRRGGTQVTT